MNDDAIRRRVIHPMKVYRANKHLDWSKIGLLLGVLMLAMLTLSLPMLKYAKVLFMLTLVLLIN